MNLGPFENVTATLCVLHAHFEEDLDLLVARLPGLNRVEGLKESLVQDNLRERSSNSTYGQVASQPLEIIEKSERYTKKCAKYGA